MKLGEVDDFFAHELIVACAALRDGQRLSAVLCVLRKQGWSVGPLTPMHVFAAMLKSHSLANHALAFELWEQILQWHLQPSEAVCRQMIEILVHQGQLEQALKIFESMKARCRGPSHDVEVSILVLLKGFTQSKDCDRALGLFQEAKDLGVHPSLVLVNTLINVCCRAKNMDRAAEVFCSMLAMDIAPDIITYSTLIKGYCLNSQLDDAMEMFALMKRNGLKPDVIVFTCLLDGCANHQMVALSEQVIEDMIEAGISPSNHTASVLIKLYGRAKDLESAFKVLEEYPVKFGFRPNKAVYTALMSTCTWHRRNDLSLQLLERMVTDGESPDDRTYLTLLRGACKSGEPAICGQIIKRALDQAASAGTPVSRLLEKDTTQVAIGLLCRAGSMDQGLAQQLRKAGYQVLANFKGSRGTAGQKYLNGREALF